LKPEPDPGDRACPPPGVGAASIRELTAWIAGHTDYDTARTARDPPSVTFCNAGETNSHEGKAEWEAYKLQEAWLAEQGLASGFDWPQIFLLSRCPWDVHP